MKVKDEFLQRILAAFKQEAEEIIGNMTASFLELEEAPDHQERQQLLEGVYRQAHTLKGAARAVDLLDIEAVCQEMESVFSAFKSGDADFSVSDLDIMHQAVETIQKIVMHQMEGEVKEDYDIHEINTNLQKLLVHRSPKANLGGQPGRSANGSVMGETEVSSVNRHSAASVPAVAQDKTEDQTLEPETIRIPTSRLDKILLQVEDMLSVKLSSGQVLKELSQLIRNYQLWEKRVREVVPDVQLLQQMLDKKHALGDLTPEDKAVENAVRYLLRGNSLSKRTGDKLSRLENFWQKETFEIYQRIDRLLQDVKNIVTVPFSEVLNLFPKIVRDYCREHDKSVKLIMLGDTIEIDRRILEKIKNPLIHLLRNSLDHGIEKPTERQRKGKPETGTIKVNLERSENKRIRFIIEDDGGGINLKKLKMQVQKHSVNAAEDLETEEKLVSYIFKSGISTSDMITEYSGRGLGLAIVNRAVTDLEGSIRVETEKDKGARFTIELPLSLVTFRGIIIKLGDNEFVIPTTKIERIMMLDKTQVQTIENKRVIYFEKELVPLAELAAVLDIMNTPEKSDHILVILINSDSGQVGLRIDDVVGEQEILAKDFNLHLKRIRNVSGATILGSGKVVPILNPADLVKSVFQDMNLLARVDEESAESKKQILVVEDSVTSRLLMKNILEHSGYKVETAFDGKDGYSKVLEGNFDLVISDVDMPRMNGFDMTAMIKSDRQKGSTPVILVTSLNIEEHLKKGEEAGANGYIVKSNFAQSNLIETIEKLIQEKS